MFAIPSALAKVDEVSDPVRSNPASWRELYKNRSRHPDLHRCMDQSLKAIRALLEDEFWDSELDESGSESEPDSEFHWSTEHARKIISAIMSVNRYRNEKGLLPEKEAAQWAAQIFVHAASGGHFLTELQMYTSELVDMQDAWWEDGVTQANESILRERLYDAQLCCSGIRILLDELTLAAHKNRHLEDYWSYEMQAAHAGGMQAARENRKPAAQCCQRLLGVVEEELKDSCEVLENTIEALYVEGYDVSIPGRRRPVGVPRWHQWWWYRSSS
tara:strand:- start:2134 stop:2952 length:819 start_codon:yes stop_codon:yes gene_type:complete